MRREHKAYRIAGQAVGAVLFGMRIRRASVGDGLELYENSGRDVQKDGRTLGRIAVILMGVGAKSRYSFGVPPGNRLYLMPRPDEPVSMRDIEEADAISVELSVPGFSQLWALWQYVGEIMTQDDVWEAVELIAGELLDAPLDSRQIVRLCGAIAQSDEDQND